MIMSAQQASEETIPEKEGSVPKKIGPFTVRRWFVIVFFAFLILLLMQPILDPYGEKGYMEISHGNHVHYVPRDRDPNVSISNFPTTPPGPNERITPDGRIVPK